MTTTSKKQSENSVLNSNEGEKSAIEPLRLLIVSSGSKNSHLLPNMTRPNIKKTMYQYESSTLDDILAFVIAELGGIKVESIAFILHGNEKEMFLAEKGSAIISSITVMQEENIKEFFVCLSSTFLNTLSPECRIDFLNCSIKEEVEVISISQAMKKLINCSIGIHNDLYGSDVKDIVKFNGELKSITVGELYFFPEKLEEFLNLSLHSQIQNLSGYEKVRTVGKGAFGTAILYRKKDDDSLVIVKEINMHDLTASERQLAINEVSVLSMLNHENIVSYYDSFEEDGVLMIEMEYADGGTLAQYLSQMKNPLEEREILLLFKQILSAIKHMHDHNILHRDLKTANIFLTKEGIVKVGDFGISKMLTTRQGGAITVVGTPYYISPEMCEGKFYNQKSDIWALGCILYEMACLQKTFEGSNLPALVNKIVKGHFAPVKGNYSPGFKQLVRDLLQKDPDFRPTAAEILDKRLPELLNFYEDTANKDYDDTEISMDFNYQGQPTSGKSTMKQLRSVLYDVKMYQADISLTAVLLPPHSRIKEVALSSTHMIVLTSESLAYTWGDGRKGQLGHGKLETWREKPLCVEALKGKNITRICAGEGFSVFASDNGIVMTCGNGSQGCLGHGDWNMCVKPKLIEKLLSVDVSAVSCGPHHVVVVGGEGEAYAWGCGAGGRLGSGTEEDRCSPTEVQFPNDIRAKHAYCGRDGTMFITETGSLLACGMNEFNKLGLNEQRGFLPQMKHFIAKSEVEKQIVPVKLGWLRQRVVSVSMGMSHTAVLVDPGKLITFGCNKSGQLGRGNLRNHSTPSVVKSMGDRTVTMVQCGDIFTVAGTAENAVYFWGSRQVLSSSLQKRENSVEDINYSYQEKPVARAKFKKSHDSEYASEISEASVSEVIKIGESNSPLMREIERIGPDSPIIQVKTPDVQLNESSVLFTAAQRRSFAGPSKEESKDNLVDSCTGRKDIILHPQEILALYASPAQIAKGEIVKLQNLYCFGMQVYLVVDTTAPLPRHQTKKPKPFSNVLPINYAPINENAASEKNDVLDEDSLGPIPDWLKMELINAGTSEAAYEETSQITNKNNSRFTRHEAKNDNNFKQNQVNGNPPKQTSDHYLSTNENSSHGNKMKQSVSETTLKKELEKIILQKKEAEEKLRKLEQQIAEKNKAATELQPLSYRNEREKELEDEILKLREELRKRLWNPRNSKESEIIVADDSSHSKKKSAFKSYKNHKRTKSQSKICILQ